MNNKKIFGLAVLVVVVLALPVTYAANNVSILYGWNGTNFVPVQITSEGAIKMDINMTQAVGITPKINNTYDLGSLSRLWANLYVRSVRGGSGPLSFFANGNEVITLLTNGNVGIGTTTPQTRLDVEGGANITGDLLVSNVSILTRQSSDNATLTASIGTKVNLTQLSSYETTSAHSSDNTTLGNRIGAQETKQSADNTTISDRFSVAMPASDNATLTASLGQKLNLTGGNVSGAINLATSSGNVGIGTTTPEQQLTVIGTANITGGVIAPNVTFSDGSTQTSASIGTNVSLLYGMNESSTSQPIAVKVDSSGALKMAISGGTGTGWSKSGSNVFLNNLGDNVGIGTTNPTFKLDVNGVINASGLLVNGTAISTGATGWTTNATVVYNNTNTVQIGIGMANPGAKLDVSASSMSVIRATSGDLNYAALLIGDNGVNSYGLKIKAGNNNVAGRPLLINSYDDATTYMIINGLGRVGIGSAAPASTLEVNGTIRITPTATGTCNAAVEGSIFYNTTEKHMYMCNSTNWLRLDNTYI